MLQVLEYIGPGCWQSQKWTFELMRIAPSLRCFQHGCRKRNIYPQTTYLPSLYCFIERGEMNLILSRNHLEFCLFWNHFKVGRPTWLPLTSWRVIEKNIWNYVVSMYLISDITVSTPGWPYGASGRATFESNNFSGNEIIFSQTVRRTSVVDSSLTLIQGD